MSNYSVQKEDLAFSSDASIRDIVHSIIYGTGKEKPRGSWIVLQSLIRDNEGRPISSKYSYKIFGEGKHKNRGPNTTRTGYLCKEKLYRMILQPASRMIMDETTRSMGKMVPERDVVYFSYKNEIREQDVIIQIKIDEDGYPENPITAIKESIITKVYPKKSDNGRVEFYAAIIEDQK